MRFDKTARALHVGCRIRQLWHVIFGHVGYTSPDLPQSYCMQFMIQHLQDAGAWFYYVVCPCGIIEQHYQAALMPALPHDSNTTVQEHVKANLGGSS